MNSVEDSLKNNRVEDLRKNLENKKKYYSIDVRSNFSSFRSDSSS